MKNPLDSGIERHIDPDTQTRIERMARETWDQRRERLLPEHTSPPLKSFISTSVRDISELADVYIDDPLVHKLFLENGTHNIISDDEQSIVEAVTTKNDRIDWSRRDPELADIAQALARSVIAGKYSSSHCEDAEEFIADRLFSRPNNHSPLRPYREDAWFPTASELLDAARFFYNQERFRTLFFDYVVSKKDQSDDDVLYIMRLQNDYVRTHGLRIRVSISGAIKILDALRSGKLHSLDDREALDYVLDPAVATGSRESEARLINSKNEHH